MVEMVNALIPFGKYKDQPVEALLSDQSYVQWLLAQAWFAQRYGQLHMLVMNNGVVPDDTPEHNAMQLRFLDDHICRQACQAWMSASMSGDRLQDVAGSIFEQQGIDVQIWFHFWTWQRFMRSEWKVYRAWWGRSVYRVNGPEELLRDVRREGLGSHSQGERYPRWNWTLSPRQERLTIELKPSLGDDYPTVLRKMLAPHGAMLLLFDTWTSQMPLVQVQQLFKKSGRLLLPYSTLSTYSTEPGARPIERPQEI